MAREPIAPQPKRPPEPVHYIGEPRRVCRNCEHFDGGGIDKNGQPNNHHGDCHNGISGRLQTTADETCIKGFYPCAVRWPLEKRTHSISNGDRA